MVNISDVTFLIPTFFDHRDRDENVSLTVKMLKNDFDCQVIVGENQTRSFSHLGDRYMKFNYPEFHRTRILNQMAYAAKTPIIVNWDADVILPPLQLYEAVLKVRGGADMVYPYDGRFARVPRTYYQQINEFRDIGMVGGKQFRGTSPSDPKSVGGAILFNKKSFFEGGGENEHFRSYGPEDQERYYRFTKLGYRVERVEGIIYHIDHEITLNSSMSQPSYKDNKAEWEKVKKLNDLRGYVDSWDFTSTYDKTYHSDIKDTKSAKIVLDSLPIKFKTVVDIGCGNKSWDTGEHQYTGVDFNVPNVDIDADIRKPFDIGRFDLCISMEVAEHLPESAADTYIDNLCRTSDQILFSAAIPGQEGENHINCQWQSYWAAKFRERGYYPQEVRDRAWNNDEVAVWYRQNMILYTKTPSECELDKVHPRMYLNLLGLN